MFVTYLHAFHLPIPKGSLVIAYKVIGKYTLRFCTATVLFIFQNKVIITKVKYFSKL